jgi:hypothetical protein
MAEIRSVDATVRGKADIASSALLFIYEHANGRLTPGEMHSISVVRNLCHELSDGDRESNS